MSALATSINASWSAHADEGPLQVHYSPSSRKIVFFLAKGLHVTIAPSDLGHLIASLQEVDADARCEVCPSCDGRHMVKADTGWETCAPCGGVGFLRDAAAAATEAHAAVKQMGGEPR